LDRAIRSIVPDVRRRIGNSRARRTKYLRATFTTFTLFSENSTQHSAISNQHRNRLDAAIRSIVPDVRRRIGMMRARRAKNFREKFTKFISFLLS
jgi:hypothetical protein